MFGQVVSSPFSFFFMWQDLTNVFKEKLACFPEPWQNIFQVNIPKTGQLRSADSALPASKLRPISLMNCSWRIYIQVRFSGIAWSKVGRTVIFTIPSMVAEESMIVQLLSFSLLKDMPWETMLVLQTWLVFRITLIPASRLIFWNGTGALPFRSQALF